MKSRMYARKKSTREQTPDFSTAPAQPMFQSRPFVVQTQQAEQSQQPDLKKSLMRAERYGHHISRMHPAGVSVATPVQQKMVSRGGQKLIAQEVTQEVQQKSAAVHSESVVQRAKNKNKGKREEKAPVNVEEEKFSLSENNIHKLVRKITSEITEQETEDGDYIEIVETGAKGLTEELINTRENLTNEIIVEMVLRNLSPQAVSQEGGSESQSKPLTKAHIENWLKSETDLLKGEERESIQKEQSREMAEEKSKAATSKQGYTQSQIDNYFNAAPPDKWLIADILKKEKISGYRANLEETYVSKQDDRGGFGQTYRVQGKKWEIHVHRDVKGNLTKAHVKLDGEQGTTGQSADIEAAKFGNLANIGIKKATNPKTTVQVVRGTYKRNGQVITIRNAADFANYQELYQPMK